MWSRWRLRKNERGASAVEFALLAPLFFMVIFGMFNGGLAYSRKISVTGAVREATRYGATLPVKGTAGTCTLGDGSQPFLCWFELIRDRAISSAEGDLNTTWGGQGICVSYIGSSGTYTRTWAGATGPTVSSSPCFDDTRPAGENRVQVTGKRNTDFNVIFFSTNLVLSSEAVARFEAVST